MHESPEKESPAASVGETMQMEWGTLYNQIITIITKFLVTKYSALVVFTHVAAVALMP